MELHFVHYNSKYKDIGEAIQNEDGLAVLGVLFELSPYDNPNLNPLLNAIPAIQKGHWEAWNTYPQNFRKLLPVDTKSFYRYQGSLTTPPCSEVVTWTVFHDKLPISERQLKALRTLSNYERFYLYSTYRYNLVWSFDIRSILLFLVGPYKSLMEELCSEEVFRFANRTCLELQLNRAITVYVF